MIDELYQKSILRHAANACQAGHLAHPQGTATVQSPVCGDRITMEICLEDGLISDLAYTTRSCVLCQASASIIGETAIGKSPAELQLVGEEVAKLLSAGDFIPQWPHADWSSLETFKVVRDHKNRHACVTLPFNAVAKAAAAVSMNVTD